LLFLVDELLAGTNSRDRQVGGAAILQGLVARGAIGLATTHDLALAAVTDTDALRDGKARNVHFQDVIEGDRVVFDYKLRDGVVERSNALALMRAVGLDV
jgi:DNA mismatch repair ATPase MutS